MCEPTHSIVQFPNKDDDDNPTAPRIETIGDSGWIIWARKKIMDWFHFSKMGFGHSESLSKLTPTARSMLPINTKYETQWWIRKTIRDGRYYGLHQAEAPLALECAAEYAKRVSVGNLTLLRQFLEMTMKRSEKPSEYIGPFCLMLSERGKNEFFLKMQRLLGIKSFYAIEGKVAHHLELIIKVMLGFTRKRDLLVPEWADDSKLWKGKIAMIV
jgi:hypothetical protein